MKVLTRDHRVELPRDLEFQPPRLGEVGDARLYNNRRLEFGKRAPDPQPIEKIFDVERVPIATETPASAELDPRILKTVGSLKRAAWFAAVLLALIFLTTLSKN